MLEAYYEGMVFHSYSLVNVLLFSRPAQFKADFALTQMTSVLAKLHRATMRNWHHIQLIVQNMASEAASNNATSNKDSAMTDYKPRIGRYSVNE